MKIALVICYMGPLPRYFDLFLASCEWNPDVDFLIVSDRPLPRPVMPNIRWVQMTLGELNEHLAARLGFEVHVEKAYKLCDFKPTYGHTLADWLEGYDFWGHIDADVLFGDIRSVLTDELLGRYDVLSLRGAPWISGAFTLFRNEERVNLLFKEAPAHESMLQNPVTQSFTETCGQWDGALVPIAERVQRGERVSMTDVVFNLAEADRLAFCNEDHLREYDPRSKPFFLRWEAGALYDERRGDKIILYHLLFAKKDPFFYVPVWERLPERFFITNEGVTEVRPAASLARLGFQGRRLLAGLPGFAKASRKRARGYVKRRLGGLLASG
jgi:hypothetical protein